MQLPRLAGQGHLRSMQDSCQPHPRPSASTEPTKDNGPNQSYPASDINCSVRRQWKSSRTYLLRMTQDTWKKVLQSVAHTKTSNRLCLQDCMQQLPSFTWPGKTADKADSVASFAFPPSCQVHFPSLSLVFGSLFSTHTPPQFTIRRPPGLSFCLSSLHVSLWSYFDALKYYQTRSGNMQPPLPADHSTTQPVALRFSAARHLPF